MSERVVIHRKSNTNNYCDKTNFSCNSEEDRLKCPNKCDSYDHSKTVEKNNNEAVKTGTKVKGILPFLIFLSNILKISYKRLNSTERLIFYFTAPKQLGIPLAVMLEKMRTNKPQSKQRMMFNFQMQDSINENSVDFNQLASNAIREDKPKSKEQTIYNLQEKDAINRRIVVLNEQASNENKKHTFANNQYKKPLKTVLKDIKEYLISNRNNA